MVLDLSSLKVSDNSRDQYLLRRAYQAAWNNSEDITTKTGAIVTKNDKILLEGFNHFVLGAENLAERHEKPHKYHYTIHAEEDLVSKAANKGISLRGSTMYMPGLPCTPCYRMITNSGIDSLVLHKQMLELSPERWEEDLKRTIEIAKNARFKIRMYDGKIGNVASLFDGKEWRP